MVKSIGDYNGKAHATGETHITRAVNTDNTLARMAEVTVGRVSERNPTFRNGTASLAYDLAA